MSPLMFHQTFKASTIFQTETLDICDFYIRRHISSFYDELCLRKSAKLNIGVQHTNSFHWTQLDYMYFLKLGFQISHAYVFVSGPG
jgi:hypothetical protein